MDGGQGCPGRSSNVMKYQEELNTILSVCAGKGGCMEQGRLNSLITEALSQEVKVCMRC